MGDLRKHIKHAANQHKELVNNDALWAGIESKMKEPKKDKRIIPFWIWGLSSLVLIISFIGVSYILNETEHITDKTRSIAKTIDKNTEIKSADKFATKQDKPIKTASSNDLNSNLNETQNANDNQPKTTKEITTQISTTQKFNKSSAIYDETIQPEPKSIIEIANGQPFSSEQKNKQILRKINEENKNPIFQQNINLVDSRIILLQRIPSFIPFVDYKDQKLTIHADFVTSPILSDNETKMFSFLSSMTIYGHYGMGVKDITGTGPNIDLRNDSEELLDQIRLGVEFDIIKMLDFTLYGGLSYTSINDRVRNDESYSEYREITYLDKVQVMPDGTEIETFKTETLPHQIKNTAIRYNSRGLISLPVGLRFGREFSNFKVGIGFGLDFNYALSSTQDIIGTDMRLTSVSSDSGWLIPKLHTSVSLDYPISNRVYFHTKLNYRTTRFEGLTLGNNTIENYSLYGIDLGVRFQF